MEIKPAYRSLIAFVLCTLLTATIIAIALQRLVIFPVVLIFVTAAVLAVGIPLYLFVRSQDWINGATAAVAGAITGAAIPASLLLLDFDVRAWRLISVFALLGAVMGLVFLLLFRRRHMLARSQARAGAAAALLAGLTLAFFQFGFDHSCHNPGIRGALARYPDTSFTINLPDNEWPQLRGEIERFASERGWSTLRSSKPGEHEAVEICTLPATLITARLLDGTGTRTRFYISVETPLDDDEDFRAPMRTLVILQDRIAARWPEAISRDEVERLKWLAAPNGKPSPTPSSAIR